MNQIREAAPRIERSAPREPIILQLDDHSFAVASYRRTVEGFAIYGVKPEHRNIRSTRVAVTITRRERDQARGVRR